MKKRLNEIQILTSQSKSMTEIDFGGPVESIGSAWKINGLMIKTDGQTQIDANIAVGDYANVHGTLLADGAVQAHEIKSHKLEINGVISKIVADRWTLGEVELQINSRTQISGEPKIGSQALAKAVLLGDGKWLAIEISLGKSGFEENLEPSETTEYTNTKASPTKTPEPRETEASKTPESTETREATKTQEPSRAKLTSLRPPKHSARPKPPGQLKRPNQPTGLSQLRLPNQLTPTTAADRVEDRAAVLAVETPRPQHPPPAATTINRQPQPKRRSPTTTTNNKKRG
ncbi:MAG: hypothetical protein IPN59_13635 [Holophaga sp.]|nr:hypothetical protein [Holophaga sp.]